MLLFSLLCALPVAGVVVGLFDEPTGLRLFLSGFVAVAVAVVVVGLRHDPYIDPPPVTGDPRRVTPRSR